MLLFDCYHYTFDYTILFARGILVIIIKNIILLLF